MVGFCLQLLGWFESVVVYKFWWLWVAVDGYKFRWLWVVVVVVDGCK